MNFETNRIQFECMINKFTDECVKDVHTTYRLLKRNLNKNNNYIKSEYTLDKSSKVLYYTSKLNVLLSDLVDCLIDINNVYAFDSNITYNNYVQFVQNKD